VTLDGVLGDGDIDVEGWAGALLAVAAKEVGVFVAAACDGVLDDHPSGSAGLVAVSAIEVPLR